MDKMAKIELDGKVYEFPCVVGSENEKAINISSLRAQTGYITLDEGYMNTGSCQSAITYIDGENGILRYRGIPIEELAEKVSVIEVAYLLVMGYLPNPSQLRTFSDLLTRNQMIHEDIKIHFEGFPSTSHPWLFFQHDQRIQLFFSGIGRFQYSGIYEIHRLD
jgi:citrate synthase